MTTPIPDDLEPCQPIGCDNGHHLPGCHYALVDSEIQPSNHIAYYFKLLDSNGQEYLIRSIQVPVHQFIGALEFGTIERGDKPYRPLVRTPFYRHDDLKRLHTICSRIDDDEITEVEW